MFLYNKISTETELLKRLCAPWKTGAQLERLSLKPRSTFEPFEFAVLGDVEPGRFWISRALFNREGIFPKQLSSIQENAVDFCVQLGDMVSRGVARQYLDFLRQLNSISVTKPYLTVIGNHDRSRPHGQSHSRVYRRIFGKNNYYFDYGGARFIILDSSAKRLTCAQLRWLNLVLDTSLRKIVFTHMPPVILNLWGGSAVHHIWGFSRGAGEFTRVLSERGVDRVYMGHIHGFGVQDFEGVRYVLSGGGGSPLFPSGVPGRFHHYLTVTVGPQGICERVHPVDGEPFAVVSGRLSV